MLSIASSDNRFCLLPTAAISLASIIRIDLFPLLNTSSDVGIEVDAYKLPGNDMTASIHPNFTNFSRILLLIPPFHVVPLVVTTTAFPSSSKCFIAFKINNQSAFTTFLISGITDSNSCIFSFPRLNTFMFQG